ncbi:MAG: riboflavin biosynthesis protein RibF [Proteobacteria bacterium]|nr:MAG: riboflavin biosynthesis protein RibF [Pseudomonadota bacterium]
MKVIQSQDLQNHSLLTDESSSLTIGNFDGCHLGHQELLRLARRAADERGAKTTVLTFDPHPREYFQPTLKLPRLFQPEQKLRALEELGVDRVVVQSFDQQLSQLTPERFCKDLLLSHLQTTAVTVGYDFRFGKGRTGTLSDFHTFLPEALIQEAGEVSIGGQTASSSMIRKYLQLSNIFKANELLGRAYLLEGVIQKGKQLGRQLGFPTANIDVKSQLLPEAGVYCGYAVLRAEAPIFEQPESKIPCILNIGYRPTIAQDKPQLLVETHLLTGEYGQDALYDLPMGIYLTHHIRGEKKFNGLDELKAQIQTDCEKARAKTAQ